MFGRLESEWKSHPLRQVTTYILEVAGLAQAKNRSGLNWFIVSVILGPLATFLLVAAFEKLP